MEKNSQQQLNIMIKISCIILLSICFGCSKNNKLLYKEKIPNKNLISLQKTNCLGKDGRMLIQDFNATWEKELTCCLVEKAASGNKQSEKIIIDQINNYDHNYSNGYVYCHTHESKGVCTKKIFEAQLSYIERNSKLFECKTDTHDGLYCAASMPLRSLEFGMKALSEKENDLDSVFTNRDSIPDLYDDTCGCKIEKATFYAINELYRNGVLDLLEYASISRDSIK